MALAYNRAVRLAPVFFIPFLILQSCAQSSTNVNVTLVYGEEQAGYDGVSNARELIESNAAATSYRIMYRHDGLDAGTWVVQPKPAEPPFIVVNEQRFTIWEQAEAGGALITQAQISARSIPYRRKGLQIAIEFLQEFRDNTENQIRYFTVAYGCYTGPLDRGLTEEQFTNAMAQGIRIFAGRTCGACPSLDPDSRDQDHPQFTVANFATNSPPDCP